MKRFSLRETALLLSPVLLMGVWGFWSSKSPVIAKDDGKPRLTFHMEPPTTLQAFQGAQATLVVGFNQGKTDYRHITGSPYFELQTARGAQVSRMYRSTGDRWGKVWLDNINGSRFPVRTKGIPAGELSFGCEAGFYSPTEMAKDSLLKTLSLKSKWKIDRTQIRPQNLAAWPRQPRISLKSVIITRLDTIATAGERRVNGEALFHLDDSTMTGKTPVELKVSSSNAMMGSAANATWSKTPRTRRDRATEWTVYSRNMRNPSVRVTGRISANGRWPLGFEIEPFNFKTARVGQKLKFKSFPVPLPKG